MKKVEIDLLDELESELVKPDVPTTKIGEFFEKVKNILSFLNKGETILFLGTKVVQLLKEIREVADALKEIKEEIADLRAKSGDK